MHCNTYFSHLSPAIPSMISIWQSLALGPSSEAALTPGKTTDNINGLKDKANVVARPVLLSQPSKKMEANVRDREQKKMVEVETVPGSLRTANSTSEENGEKRRPWSKPVKTGNARSVDHKSDPVRRKPFTMTTRRSIPRKADADDREKTVSKAVIDFMGKQSKEDASHALTRAAQAFGNQPSMWDQMMRQLEHRGARGKAFEIFQFLRAYSGCDLNERNFVTIIGILGRDGKLAVLRDIFDSMRTDTGITPSAQTYSAVISGYQKQGLVSKAWEIYELMQSSGCSPNIITYNALIHTCIKEPEKVFTLLRALQKDGLQPDDITYNCVINACINSGDLGKASFFLDEMRKHDLYPNLVTYTSLINAYGKAGQLDTSVTLFAEMKKNGRLPNSWTYNSLLKAYADEGMYEEASVLYREMEHAGCLPTLYTFNTVIGLYGKGELFVEAENVLIDMQRRGLSPDRVTYNTLIYSYGRAGHLTKAMEVFQNMASQGCRPDLWTYNILLDSVAKHGTVEQTIKLYSDLETAGHRPNVVTYGTLMTLYGRSGMYEEALRTLQGMGKASCVPNVTVYSGLIQSFSQHGMSKEAQVAFQDMVKAGIRPDVRSYTVLMDAFAKAGLCNEAEHLLLEMEENGFIADPITYSVLARAFAIAKRWHDGLKYYKLLQQQADSSSREFSKMLLGVESEYSHFVNSKGSR